MILLYILLSIFGVFLLLLTSPIGFEYVFNYRAGCKQQLHIVWLFGLVRFKLKPSAKPAAGIKLSTTEKFKKKPKKKQRKSRGFKPVFAVLRSQGFNKRLIQLLYELFSSIEIRQLNANLRFGLEDPAETGIIYGYLSPVYSLPLVIPKCTFDIFPVFDRAVLEFEIKTDIYIIPVKIIWVIVRFVISPQTLRAVSAAIRENKI